MGDASCFHCGTPVPPGSHWSVQIDSAPRALCCPGCAAVAQAIVDNGLDDYYRSRSGLSPKADDESLVPPELMLYDAPEVVADFAAQARAEEGVLEATLSIGNIRCAACVWLIERRLLQVPGVRGAQLNVAAEKLRVRWQRDACKPSDIFAALRELGYAAYPYDPARHQQQLQLGEKRLFRQMFVAGLSMMQVMMYAYPAYIAADGTMEADMARLMRWASLALTLPAVFYSALPFFQGAWSNLKSRMLGMDVPVALGIGAAFLGSVIATLRDSGEVYFDSVTMFIFLLIGSRYLELLARRKAASALERLQHALPASASRLPDYPLGDAGASAAQTVPAAQLRAGDVILIKPGETIAADCRILEGDTRIDASLLSGESRLLRKAADDELPGGAVNVSQAVIARVLRPTRESTLSALLKLVERAGEEKPRLALWADRVAAWFVGGLLLLAAAVFAWWHWADPSRAWPIAIAVLVVSCPCALSLAMPTALAAAVDRLARQGVLVVQAHVPETLQRATHVIFDKTGTLTHGRPVLRRMAALGSASETDCLRIAAALESGCAHPLAAAIMAAARKQALAVPGVSATNQTNGAGIEGTLDGRRYRLGHLAFVGEVAGAAADDGSPDSDATPVYLGCDGQWLARLELVDTVRADARDVVRHFKAIGKRIMLLSGDGEAVVRHVAADLGIDDAHGGQKPECKLAFVQQLQREGAVVAMVGDGINDAAVLQAADVSFAMGAGAAIAQTHADAVLLTDRLSSLIDAADAARQTMAVVKQNLAWASVYNLIAIPSAALGLLNPWLSAVGMSVSSVVVLLNALRLRRVPRQRTPAVKSVELAPSA
ncbi:Cu2+-exporting ATPase [Noviherbaspirillum humi]|uniref:Cu2+-exporting ATPase n=1 Tax=Noviherbaspirillum humi TaxID=1688639 RepID=A0A239ITI5_9BURK|nr:heavy metal translocating P-type ATPase [Noviherbaspirillum humi]SNS96879.1 Cu2+-exporting ATPase [Noviherbaspirillum humi]